MPGVGSGSGTINPSGNGTVYTGFSNLSIDHPYLTSSIPGNLYTKHALLNASGIYQNQVFEISKPSGLNLFMTGYIPGLQTIYTGYGLNSQPIMSPPLFMNSIPSGTSDGQFPLSITGYAPSINANFPLYLEQHAGGTSIPLYINGVSGFQNIQNTSNLFIKGMEVINGNVPLILFLDTIVANSIPLYISGPNKSTNSIPLYMNTQAQINKSLNIFMKVGGITKLNSNIPLILNGASSVTGNSIAIGTIPLFMGKSSGPSSTVPLFISGLAGKGVGQETLNLVLISNTPKMNSSVPLFLNNLYKGVSSSKNLYIKGAGKNPGYYFAAEPMNLFIEGYGNGPFASPISQSAMLSLLIKGSINLKYRMNNSIPLYMEVPDDYEIDNFIDLFMSGGLPANINSSIPLIIPRTNLIKNIPLYIHGF